MFLPDQSLELEEIDLSALAFWDLPLSTREGAFKTLREQSPIRHFEDPEWMFGEGMTDGRGFWVATRYQDVYQISRRPEVYNSSPSAVSIPDLPEGFTEFFGSMINTDDPRHALLRRIVSRSFTPKRIAQLEDRISYLSHEIVSRSLDLGEFDFVSELASELPLRIICEMMGIPESQNHYVLERSNTILGAFDEEYVSADRNIDEALLTAALELTSLMEEIGKEKLANPVDDLTSSLLHGDVEGESLSASELAAFFILLVVAGNETTRNAISWAMYAMSEFPDQKRVWMENFEGHAQTAVEEIIRWASPVVFMRRTVAEQLEIGGINLDKGQKVLLMYGSANRDESAFSDPYRFDLTRNEERHLAFGGYGPHFCLGAHLARREIKDIFREIFALAPKLEVVGTPSLLRSNFINGIKHLPVTNN